MSENINLEQLQSAQNAFFAAQTADIDELRTNTAAVLSTLESLANRVYGYDHTDFAVKTLEESYAGIITANQNISDASAVGFTALLKDGDTVPIQGNIMFINGTQEVTDYTFSGGNSAGGAELVTVWYFANSGVLNVSTPVNFAVIDFISKIKSDISGSLSVHNSYINFADYAEINRCAVSGTIYGIKNFVTHDAITSSSAVSGIREYTDYGITALKGVNLYNPFVESSGNPPSKSSYFKITYPEAESITFATYTFALQNLSELELFCPKLKSFSASSNGYLRNIRKFTFPETVTTISGTVVGNINTVVMNCKDAESISDNWCTGNIVNFSICGDWGASINLAVAAANWSKADFVDFFTDGLRNMEDEVREIKIPSEIYDSLTDEEFAFAEDKGWTVGA